MSNTIELLQIGCTAQMILDTINALVAAHNDGANTAVVSYNDLTDKPVINGVTLSGSKTTQDLKIKVSEAIDFNTFEAAFASKGYVDAADASTLAAASAAVDAALDDKLDADLSNLAAADYLNSEGKVLVIADGTPKVMSLNSFMACVSILQESSKTTVAAATASEKRIYIPVSWTAGVMTITASTAYKTGSTALFVNGVLLKNGTDYSETTPTTITLLSYTPKANDTIQLLAIPE